MEPPLAYLPLPARPGNRPARGAHLPRGADRLLRQAPVDFYRDNDLGRIEGFHFWLRSVASHPSDIYPNQRWAFWQYTGTGLVEGVDGPTDINVFGGTRSQWASWAY